MVHRELLLGYGFSFIDPFYTTHEDFSDRLSDVPFASAQALWARRARCVGGEGALQGEVF